VKFAQVAPLWESVPPKYYGGTERVVWYLTEALLELDGDRQTFRVRRSNVTIVKCALVPQGQPKKAQRFNAGDGAGTRDKSHWDGRERVEQFSKRARFFRP
jgi:hypothetical protein